MNEPRVREVKGAAQKTKPGPGTRPIGGVTTALVKNFDLKNAKVIGPAKGSAASPGGAQQAGN